MSEIGAAKGLLDDTPVNGEVGKGITSNWAYDHAHDPDAHGNDLYPWTIDINPFHTPKAQTNWSTVSLNYSQILNGVLASSGAQNAQITWDVVLAKGTWSLEIITDTGSDRGIASIQFDSVEKATIDLYTSGTVLNVIKMVTAINVPTTKKIELKIKMATQNGGSSSYVGRLSSVRLVRTT